MHDLLGLIRAISKVLSLAEQFTPCIGRHKYIGKAKLDVCIKYKHIINKKAAHKNFHFLVSAHFASSTSSLHKLAFIICT